MTVRQDPDVEIFPETSQLPETRFRTLREELPEAECSEAILAFHFLAFLWLCLFGAGALHQMIGSLPVVAIFLVSMVGTAIIGVDFTRTLDKSREHQRRIEEALEEPANPDHTQNG